MSKIVALITALWIICTSLREAGGMNQIAPPEVTVQLKGQFISLECYVDSSAPKNIHWNRGNTSNDHVVNIIGDIRTNPLINTTRCDRLDSNKTVYTLTIDVNYPSLVDILPNITCVNDINGHQVYSHLVDIEAIVQQLTDPLPNPSLLVTSENSSIILHCSVSCSFSTITWIRGNSSEDHIDRIMEDNFQLRLKRKSYNRNCNEVNETKVYELIIDASNLNITSILPSATCVGEISFGNEQYQYVFSETVNLPEPNDMPPTTPPIASSSTEPTSTPTSSSCINSCPILSLTLCSFIILSLRVLLT